MDQRTQVEFTIFVRLIFWMVVAVSSLLWGESTLVRAVSDKPALFHTQYEVGSSGEDILLDLFEPLMRLDKEGKLIPGQALSWQVDTNGTRYRFRLRDNIRWSDGTPVTAEDFVYSFQNALSHPDKHLDWFISQLPIQNLSAIRQGNAPLNSLGVHALAPHRLEIVLEYPFPYLLSALSHLSTVPLPHHLADRPWPSPQNVVGNGPYRIRTIHDDTVVLEKNPYYYDQSHVRTHTIVYWNSDEETQTYRKYRDNAIDYLNEIPKNLYKQIVQ